MEKTELQMKWESRIADFKASGQTQIQWCEANNLKLHQFRYWLYKIEKKKSSSSKTEWISVTVEDTAQTASETVQIKVDQAIIEVKPGFNPSFLREVVKALKTC